MTISRRARTTATVVAITAGLVFSSPIQAGATARPQQHSQVAKATQAQTNSVLRLYRAYFRRDPDRAGLAYWVARYSSGEMSLAAISSFFAGSEEFRKTYGALSDADFVRLVYQNVLGRQPDAKGEQHWTSKLATGTSRGQVMIGFSESPEFQRKTGTVLPEPPAPERWVSDTLRHINAERAKHGLPALVLCAPLANSARGHSADQARNDRLDHRGSDGSQADTRITRAGYRWTAWGENVAAGFTESDKVVAAWMKSDTHRAIILSSKFVHIGFGRVASAGGKLYWTANFGAGGTC
ncbi:MAG: DUF4214 domain-containing protein [Acidimicrobiales bacterium]|nr:DUF4214 domain-containing protein [Acidimicrobiales bacterium]